MRDRGLISNYNDYLDLPYGVIEDARMLMQAER